MDVLCFFSRLKADVGEEWVDLDLRMRGVRLVWRRMRGAQVGDGANEYRVDEITESAVVEKTK